MKIEINIKFIIISLLVVVGLFWFFSRGCNGGTPTVANVLTDSAIKANAEKDVKLAALDVHMNALLKDSAQQHANVEAFAEETNTALTARADAEDNTKKYQQKYEKARLQLDTVLALASCDSLTLAIKNERIRAAAAQRSCSDQVNQLGDVLANRNKQISVLNEQVKVLKQPANIVNDALHAVKEPTKEPWIKGYAGASVMGNQTSFGFGPDVSFQFRGGIMVRAGAVLMGSQVMGTSGVQKLISFKKK